MGVNGIYGLSGSGLDIESLVKVGMMSKQNEYDKMYKSETKLNWKKEAYSTLYTDMTSFNLTKLSDYKMSSKMNAMTASSSDSAAVTATANGNAASMAHSVTVNSLSTNAYFSTQVKSTDSEGNTVGGISRANDDAKTSMYLKDNVLKGIRVAEGSEATYTYNDVTYTGVTSTTNAQGEVSYTLTGATDGSDDVSGLNLSSFTTHAAKYEIADSTDSSGNLVWREVDGDATAISFTLRSTKDELSESDKAAQTISYSYEDLMNGKSYNNLASDIKGMNIGIQASYDSVNDTFTVYNRTGGSDNIIAFDIAAADEGDTYSGGTYAAKLLNNLNLGKVKGDDYEAPVADAFAAGQNGETANNVGAAGTNGEVKIDGQTYTDIKDNKITVGGVTYSLLGKTNGSARVTVAQDTSSIIDNVKSFVEDYNKMLDELTEKYNETVYSDYGVLTKNQEESMTKEQVEKWNEKAKSGILYHDRIIGSIISDMRQALSTPVEGTDGRYNSAFSLGISTTNDRGHIQLDEDKLKKALEAEPNSVYQIFGKLDSNDDYSKNGVAQRLSDVMYTGLKKIKAEAGASPEVSDGSTIGNKILEWQTKMSDFKKMMSTYENMLYKKYDNMETAIQKLTTSLGFVTYNNN